MPIYRDKEAGCWRFEFDRVIPGRGRFRARRRLPKAWSRAQADAYDRTEVGRIYAVETGIAPRQRPGIEDAIVYYLNDKADQKTTRETACELARIFWVYRGRPLDELPAVARELTTHGKTAGWSAATVRNRIALLRAACRWGWKRHDMGEHDPGGKVVLPRVRNERSNFLTRREVILAARSIKHRDTRAAVLVGFYSGMRLAEVLRAIPIAGMWTVTDTKNGDDAVVPIQRKVAAYSRRWPRLASRNTVQAYVRLAFNAIGRKDASFHTLRHSAATAILATGASLDMVGDILRHRDPRSTKRYAHRQREHMVAAMERMADRPNGSPTPSGSRTEKAA